MVSFSDLSIKSKLLVCYLAVFISAISLGGVLLYFSVRHTLETNIENELRTSTRGILNMVQTAIDASIKNHLMAIAQSNEEIVRHYWLESQNGTISEDEAKARAREALLSQEIGTTGYIYCIDSNGVIQVHPREDLNGVDLSDNEFIRRQKQVRQGYLEYDWANPGEDGARPKALYMTYFGPWDWIISVSSYREEFSELLNVDDIRKHVLSTTFGKTGYPYVMDSKGLLLVHPKLEGANIYDHEDSSGRKFIQEVCERKNGKIVYPWQNPGEPNAREKLVIFNYIPELDWIVASSSYLEEFYAPLKAVGMTMLASLAIMIVLIVPMTWWLSTSITRPLSTLTRVFAKSAGNGYGERVDIAGNDEIGQLGRYYNSFMERLEESRRKLESSEMEYRSIFENAVEGIFQSTRSGVFLTANPSMAAVLGYANPEQLLNDVKDIKEQLYCDPAHRGEMYELVERNGFVAGFETRFRRRDGSAIWVSINARGVFAPDGSLAKLEGFLTDVSRKKEFEEAQARAKDLLEERVKERTAELSDWVNELERRNVESDYLRELGEFLQVCRQVEEAYPMIRHFLGKLFPNAVSSLFIRQEPHKALVRVFVTDDSGKADSVITPEDCWALQTGKPHMVLPSDTGLGCAHSGRAENLGSICFPLVSQDELVGMLHLAFPGLGSRNAEEHKDLLRKKKRLGVIVAEHLTLALANIQLRESLRAQSIRDPLTGLYNRRYMEEALDQEMFRIKRQGASLSIIMLDVDHFKDVNDTHGHDAGDEVLHQLAAYLQSNTRGEDVACRYGGEEFVLILVNTNVASAAAKAEELRAGVEKRLAVRHGNSSISVTISLGVAGAPNHGETWDQIMQAADEALYHAKQTGRNRVVAAT